MRKNSLSRTVVSAPHASFIRHQWKFIVMTNEIAYLIGAFATDGSIVFTSRNIERISGVSWSVVDKGFADRIEHCLKETGLPVARRVIGRSGNMKNEQHRITCHSSLFAYWLYTITQLKEKVDIDLSGYESPFTEGVIDGDGTVKKDGTVVVRKSFEWIKTFPQILDRLGVRHSEREEKTPDGKPYHCVTIRRTDLVAIGTQLACEEKMRRLYGEPEKRDRSGIVRRKYACPICGNVTMTNPKSLSCRPCYYKRPEVIDQLRRQSAAANIRANQVRWGKEPQ